MKYIFFLIVSCFITTTSIAQYENKKIEIGQAAPDLVFKNPEGNEIKLSTINKKRVVLVDFWASWCGPCRRANPGLVQFHETYKNKKYKKARKGFTILSVSLDQKKESWIEAIEKDKLNWPYHMSDLGGWKSEPGKIYGVSYVPQCFLVDGNGTVIGKYNRAEDCEADLKKLLAK